MITDIESTFGFVDLAGFTALTEAHGDREAIALIAQFEDLVTRSLTVDDQLVKTIGDAVMLRFATAAGAVTGTAGIFDQCLRDPGFPVPRAGLHHGRAVARGADWYGATVNLAARVTAQARGGQLLATRHVADTARHLGVTVNGLGPMPLRNLTAPVELFDLTVSLRAPGVVIDPVCRMQVAVADAAGSLHDEGATYWFCSLTCAATFAAQPHRHRALCEEP